MGSAGLRLRRAGSPQHVLPRTSRIPTAGGCSAPRSTKARSAPCNCRFVKTYPYSFGPRIGSVISDQPEDRPSRRMGYHLRADRHRPGRGGSTLGAGGWNTFNFQSPAFGEPGALLRTGLVYDRDALFRSQRRGHPALARSGRLAAAVDQPDAGKMPRLNQWSISLQREITRDLVVDVAYVGNRGEGLPPTT